MESWLQSGGQTSVGKMIPMHNAFHSDTASSYAAADVCAQPTERLKTAQHTVTDCCHIVMLVMCILLTECNGVTLTNDVGMASLPTV